MSLSRDNDYSMYLYTCNRCRSCTVEPSPRHLPVCPSYAYFGYFAYSGGGKGYVGQGILEGKVKPTAETAEVAMNCLMCGACASSCPPGFDINAFIRDLRDHLVGMGIYANEAHRGMLEALRAAGNPWGRPLPVLDLPEFTGEEELLVFMGCNEKRGGRLMPSVAKILEASGVTWGVLADEPCCGAPLLDLGDKDAFAEQAQRTMAALEESGASRVLAPCPHCAAALAADYIEVGDLEAEPVTLPALLAELIGDGRLGLNDGPPLTATYHDPCRLARWLEDVDAARSVIEALGADLVEMERSGEWTWCCGSGGFAGAIVPELSKFAAGERLREARATGAEVLITACSYCTDMLGGRAGKKQAVVHLAELVAGRLKK